jgi:hypothetical protein
MDRISIKITFITREFVNTEFMKSLLAQLNLRENLTWSNIRSERFSSLLSKNANEETEWVLNNGNLWYFFPLMMIFILEWNRQSMLWEFRIFF